MMSTNRHNTTKTCVKALLGLLLLGPGCGEGPGGSGPTGGSATTTGSGTTEEIPTTGETSSTDSTSAGESTTGDTTTEPTTTTTTGEVTATTGDTEDDTTDTEIDTDTGGGDGLKVGLQAKSLCWVDGSYICAVNLEDELVCWGKVGSKSFQVPEEKVKSIGRHCRIMVLESGELHRLKNVEAKPVVLPPGPFELAGGVYPYGCAMAADNSMTCWVAEGYEIVEEPPPGPYTLIFDQLDAGCYTCGIKVGGTLVCWKKPVGVDWEMQCGGSLLFTEAPGKYHTILAAGQFGVWAINSAGQLAIWSPEDGNLGFSSLYESGGFAAIEIVGDAALRETGELVYFENHEGVWYEYELIPGLYTTFRGDSSRGCAIRADDSRVVCWGESESGVTDPPQD